jgi:prepilin-type processing-associated H-X9-DG protein
VLGRNNYRACVGDRPEFDNPSQQSKRGIFSGWLVYRTPAQVTDGLSKTVACGEVCVASGDNNIRGSMAVGWGVGNDIAAPLTSMVPQTCAARQGSNGQLSGSVDSAMSGCRWSDGVSAFASLHTILPPNAPSCREGNDFIWVIATASSYHPGGANVSMADGSVRFINEAIDTGRLTDNPVDSGRSPYGVWGAMGSINGDESRSE